MLRLYHKHIQNENLSAPVSPGYPGLLRYDGMNIVLESSRLTLYAIPCRMEPMVAGTGGPKMVGLHDHSIYTAYQSVSLDPCTRGVTPSFARRPDALRCRCGVAKGHMGGTSPTR